MVAGAHEQRQDQGQILGLMPKHLAVNDEWHLAERSDDAGVGAAEHLAEGGEERGEVVLDAASYSARQSLDPLARSSRDPVVDVTFRPMI